MSANISPRPASLSCTVDMQAIRKLDTKGMHDARGVLHIMSEIMAGFLCQPRFSREDSNIYNDAGDLIDAILCFVNEYEEAIVHAAREAKPATHAAVELRHWTILGFEADMRDDLADFAVHAAEAVRDEAEAKLNKRRAQQ